MIEEFKTNIFINYRFKEHIAIIRLRKDLSKSLRVGESGQEADTLPHGLMEDKYISFHALQWDSI